MDTPSGNVPLMRKMTAFRGGPPVFRDGVLAEDDGITSVGQLCGRQGINRVSVTDPHTRSTGARVIRGTCPGRVSVEVDCGNQSLPILLGTIEALAGGVRSALVGHE